MVQQNYLHDAKLEWKLELHSFFVDQINNLEQVISPVYLSVNKILYCKFFEAEALLFVAVQLLAQQTQTSLADHIIIQLISINKDGTCRNWL